MQEEQQATRRERRDAKNTRLTLAQRLRSPEALIFVLGVLCLLLIGPLRGILSAVPLLLFLATFALFIVPGLLTSRLVLKDALSGAARVPLAFVLSTGIFGLPAVLAIALGLSFETYLWIDGAVLAGFLVLAVLRAFYGRVVPVEARVRPDWLWAPFLALAGVLAYASSVRVQDPDQDVWLYLSYLQDILGENRLTVVSGELGRFSREIGSWWLIEQSAFSALSGLAPADLVIRYLGPALVVVALLALYALARTLFENETVTLVAGSLAALLFVVSLGSPTLGSLLTPGQEFISRVAEDKFAARYIFLPVALSLAVLFIRERNLRVLGLFFVVCLISAVVHPLGLILIGISVVGFGLVYLIVNWRDRRAWFGMAGLGLALFALTAPPALYLLTRSNSALSKLSAADSDIASNLIENWQYERRLLQLGDGSYIVHPSLLLDPAMLTVYLLGVPFLVWKARNNLAAQLLLGILLFVPVLAFVPFVATFISDVIGPWLLHRMTWPLLLAALLTLGWMLWEVLAFVKSRLEGSPTTRSIASFLPAIVFGLLLIASVPLALAGLRAANASDEAPQSESTCQDPTFRWMQDAMSGGTVFAPSTENACIAAQTSSVEVLGVRSQIPPGAQQDLSDFYGASTVGQDSLQELRRNGARYVLLTADSPLNVQLEHLRGFTRMDNPGQRYRVYEVDRQTLRETIEDPPAVIEANDDLNDGDLDAAARAYEQSLNANNLERRFLAHVGLGNAALKEERYDEAVENYQAAADLDPESPDAYVLLANANSAAAQGEQARSALEQAVEHDPDNVDLRLRYGLSLLTTDLQTSVEQHQAVVETSPRVPDYRVRLGSALLLAGAPDAADGQFEQAVYLAPLSAKIQSDIGTAYQLARQPEEALPYHEEALRLDPNSQLYALNLGRLHAQLSAQGDEEHFEEAEEYLTSVDDLDHRSWEPDQRAPAHVALGDLYLAWNRPEDAADAYEQALELDPDSAEAEQKLERLPR